MAKLLTLLAVTATLGACAHASAPAGAPHEDSAPDVSAAASELPSSAEIALREQTADQQVRHALARLTFGARPGDEARVRAMGVDRWIAQQLDPDRIDDGAATALLAHFPTLSRSPSELLRDYPPPQRRLARARRTGAGSAPDTTSDQRQRAPGAAIELTAQDSAALRRARHASQHVLLELETAKIARAVTSDRQLEEVMVDFWENHFNIFAGKGPERYLLASYERDAIRPYALGKFRDLLGAVARSPAMLFYLDNWESTVAPDRPALAPHAPRVPARFHGINENYGRELLELHTLGADGGYTQQDVINAARAFTGWSLVRPRENPSFIFRPQMHDAGEKIFLGHHLAAGRGIADGEEVLDILARHPSTARFIATELVRHFVSDSPPPTLVDRTAATFLRTDGDIREVLRTIFTSPEFFSRAAYRAKVKTPFELVVSTLRALGATSDTTPRTARIVARLGEPLFGHRDPNGYPDVADAWINTGSILNRINFGLAIGAGRMPGVSLRDWERAEHLDALPHAEQVDRVIDAILGGEASPDTRKVLEAGVNPLGGNASGPVAGLEQTIGLALGAPEFQRH